jgi:Holliday junction resolvasome RuvABC endonuclease subunit
MIVSLDPSITHLGWVVFDESKTGKESVKSAGVFKTDAQEGLLIQRLITQRERVRHLLVSQGASYVVMEAPYWSDFSTELLFALNQQLHQIFLDLKIFVVYLQPTTVKKIALPKMKADVVTKHHMTHQAKKELGMMGRRFSEHVADAYFVGKIGLRFYKWFFLKEIKDQDLTEAEQDLFCGKHVYTRGLKKGMTEYKGIIYRENEQFFDYRKYARNSYVIAKEIEDGGQQALDTCRIL